MPFNSVAPGPPGHDSADKDTDPTSPDDNEVLFGGRAGTPREDREIEALVKRYYTAAASENGAMFCAQLYDLIAESLVEEYARFPALAGKTCAAVASKLLTQRHAELAVQAATLQVARIRVHGPRADVMVYFGKRPEPVLVLHRQGAGWRVLTLFSSGLP